MFFTYAGAIYRIAFKHDPVWEVRDWKKEPRRTLCTIYKLQSGTSTIWKAVYRGMAKPNLKAGDRFVRSVGREIALMHAIADAASAFKVAAQVAYDSRAHAVKEVA